MKKLTNREISVLASSLTKEINKPINEANKKIEKQLEKDFLKSPEYKSIKPVFKFIPKEGSYQVRNVISSLKSIFKQRTASKYNTLPTINSTKIENEIILASIESTDLADLKTVILNKFIK